MFDKSEKDAVVLKPEAFGSETGVSGAELVVSGKERWPFHASFGLVPADCVHHEILRHGATQTRLNARPGINQEPDQVLRHRAA